MNLPAFTDNSGLAETVLEIKEYIKEVHRMTKEVLANQAKVAPQQDRINNGIPARLPQDVLNLLPFNSLDQRALLEEKIAREPRLKDSLVSEMTLILAATV